MQKIQFYLVPNRLSVTTDVTGFFTENRQVYQRKIKLYKGIDNTLEFEVKNSEQRRENVIGLDVVVKFIDTGRQTLFTATGEAIVSKPGLMSVTITKEQLDSIDPQMLSAAAYLTDGTTDRILYSDSQFGVLAHVEILDGYNTVAAEGSIIEELETFNYEFDRKEYISEIGRFGTSLNKDQDITVSLEGEYTGIVTVEATKQMSTAFGTNWIDLEPWDVEATPSKTYTGNYRFVRFRIYRDRKLGAGSGARFTVTKENGAYSNVIITLRGQNYLTGDQLTIPGSLLGGINGANDLTITVTGLITGVTSQGNIDTVTWSGIASSGNSTFESIGVDPLTRPTVSVDKIIIRN
jgi:hypothetical protein